MIKVNDTIVAPITNITTQAVALIRISGDDSFFIVNKLLKKPLEYVQKVCYRELYDNNRQELVDEVLITTFVAPHSFTGENVVEIACHGGILNTQRIIKLILKNGCRIALKGEFSQRAFLNGKISLIQAEGINDLINAKNNLALKISVDNMHGTHQKFLVNFKQQLLDIISKIQVSIDYPDYDESEKTNASDFINSLEIMVVNLTNLIKRSKMAKNFFVGIKTAIIGVPNVGKSSLLNCFLNEEKAIVSNIPGTTRDSVEGQIILKGVNLILVDTAGLRDSDNVIEKMGIEKSKKHLENSDLIILVVDALKINSSENQKLINLTNKKKVILAINKIDKIVDINQKKDLEIKYPDAAFISVINNDIEQLVDKLENKFGLKDIWKSEELILTNIHQINSIEQILLKINTALDNLKSGMPIDIIVIDLNEAWTILKDLIGENPDEEIIDNIFRKYCLGK